MAGDSLQNGIGIRRMGIINRRDLTTERAKSAGTLAARKKTSLPVFPLVGEGQDTAQRGAQRRLRVALESPERENPTSSAVEGVAVRAVCGPTEDLAEENTPDNMTGMV